MAFLLKMFGTEKVLLFLCGGLKITMKKQILEMKKKGTKLL